MALEQWAYIGEIIAAAAVIASLIYLGVQVHQSNVLSRAQTSQSMIELARQEIMELQDPELWFAWTKDEITEGAKTKLNAQLLSSMRQREFEWLARREGIIDAQMYDSYSGVIPLILGTERTRRWWKVHGHEHSFAPGFVAHVDRLLEENGLTDFYDSLDRW